MKIFRKPDNFDSPNKLLWILIKMKIVDFFVSKTLNFCKLSMVLCQLKSINFLISRAFPPKLKHFDGLTQGWETRGPRAICGPRSVILRPAIIFFNPYRFHKQALLKKMSWELKFIFLILTHDMNCQIECIFHFAQWQS